MDNDHFLAKCIFFINSLQFRTEYGTIVAPPASPRALA